MRLNNNYIRDVLIAVNDSNTTYTIKNLANLIVKDTDSNEFLSALYTIITISGYYIQVDQPIEMPEVDTNIKILGLTSKGRKVYDVLHDDAIWARVHDLANTGMPLEIIAESLLSLQQDNMLEITQS